MTHYDDNEFRSDWNSDEEGILQEKPSWWANAIESSYESKIRLVELNSLMYGEGAQYQPGGDQVYYPKGWWYNYERDGAEKLNNNIYETPDWCLLQFMGPLASADGEGYGRTGQAGDEDLPYGMDFNLDDFVDANGRHIEGIDFREKYTQEYEGDTVTGEIGTDYDWVYLYGALEYIKNEKYTEFDGDHETNNLDDPESLGGNYSTQVRWHFSTRAWQDENCPDTLTCVWEHYSLCDAAQRLIRKILKKALNSPYVDFTEDQLHALLTTPFNPLGPDEPVSWEELVSSEAEYAIDISECEAPFGETIGSESGATCTPNPCAFVPDWTLMTNGEVFFNRRTCEHSIVLQLSEECPPADMSSYVLEGIRRLIEVKKAPLVLNKALSVESTSEGGSSSAAFSDGLDISISTEEMLQSADQILLFMSMTTTEDELPSISPSGIYISTVPKVGAKLLVTVSARIFNAVLRDFGQDFSSIKDATPSRLKDLVSEPMARLKGPETVRMINQVSRALSIYSVQYAAWVFNGDGEGGADYGDLKLTKESDNLKIFREDLTLILKDHGFNYKTAEFIDITFDPTTYEINYISAGADGCPPIVLDPAVWGDRVSDAVWNNKRTLAYIHRLPDMWNDVTAREPLSWNAFVEKYTIDFISSAELNALMDTEALECTLTASITGGDSTNASDFPLWDSGPFDAIKDGIAADIFSLPAAFADKFNKMLCEGEEFERLDEDLNSWDDLLKRAGDAAFGEFFAGDQLAEMLPFIIAHFKGGGEFVDLWGKILDKYGWCGILALIDIVMACLLKGMGFEDGLLGIVLSALDSLDVNGLNRLWNEFTDDIQNDILAAALSNLDQASTSEPGGAEGPPGSFSRGGAKTTSSAIRIMEEAGKSLADAAGGSASVVVASLAEQEAREFAAYQSSLLRTDPDALNKRELHDELVAHIGVGVGPIIDIRSYVGDGTLGTGSLDYTEIQAQAFKDAMLAEVDTETLLEALMKLPGAELISNILNMFDCITPIYFSPPIDEWFKFKELNWCRLKGNFVWPNWPKFPHWPDFWRMLWQALLQIIRDLIIKAILAILAAIIIAILNALCNALAQFGDLLGDAIGADGEDLRAKLSSSCNLEGLTDEEIDDIVASMLAALSGCDPEVLRQDSQEFMSLLSLTLTDQQLVELITGKATQETLNMIKQVMRVELPDSFGECLSTSGKISDLFESVGKLIPDKFKKLPGEVALPVSPSFCLDQSALDQFYDSQCALMSQKCELTDEACAQQIENLKNRAKDDLAQLLCIVNNGPAEYLAAEIPDIFSDDPNNPGIMPKNMPQASKSADRIFRTQFKAIDQAHRRSLNGSYGFLNMVMSDKVGMGFKQAKDEIADGGLNLFPEGVATHLKEILAQEEQPERFNDGGKIFIDWNTDNTTSVSADGIWGVDYNRTFVTDIDSVYLGWPKTVIAASTPSLTLKTEDLKMQYADYKGANGQWFNFNLHYDNFEIDPDTNRSVLNDFYKIKISNWADPKYSDKVYWYNGASGENRSEDETRQLISDASYGNFYDSTDTSAGAIDLDIEEYLAIKESPKNAIYAKLMMETWKNLLPDSGPYIDAVSETLYGAYSNHYYDYIMGEYLSKFAKRMSEGQTAFTHGYPSNYGSHSKYFPSSVLAEPSEITISVWEAKFPETNAAGDFLIPWPGDLEPFPSGEKIDLIGSHTSDDGTYWDIPPEAYGGTEDYPAYYFKPPTFGGWAGLHQDMLPDNLRNGCKAKTSPLCNFKQLKDVAAEYYQDKFMDDPRLKTDPACSPEPPWNRIYPRASAAGLEAHIRATVRIYVVEEMLKGMPSFAIFQANSKYSFDDLLMGYIADKMEAGLINMTLGKNFRNPTGYYLKFMEQVAQSFGRKVDLGEIEPTGVEQEAMNRLNDAQKVWEEIDYPVISKNYWPGIGAAGNMASSPLAPSITSLLDNAIIQQSIAAKYARKVWKKYVADDSNLADARVLLRRYIKEEMDFISEQFAEDMNIPIDGVHNMFLVNKKFILGSLQSGGPINVAKGFKDGGAQLDYPKHPDLMDAIVTYNTAGATPEDAIDAYFGQPPSDPLGDGWSYMPFVLEKFIRINELSEDELAASPAYSALSPSEQAVVRRDDFASLKEIVNLEEWENYITDNIGTFGYSKITDFWKSWEFGVRISHVALEGTLCFWSDALEQLGDVADAQNYGANSRSSPGVYMFPAVPEGEYYRNEVLDNISNINVHAKKQKAFKLHTVRDGLVGEPFVLLPLVSTTKQIDSAGESTISGLISLGPQFDEVLECLIADLVKNPRYELLFGYSFSMQRILSLITIYNINGFLPSIGSRASDDWWQRLSWASKYDADKGGGRFFGYNTPGIRMWDFDELFVEPKTISKAAFNAFYHSRDFESKEDEEARKEEITVESPPTDPMAWLADLLARLSSRERKQPFDKDGNPCPLKEEED